MQEQGNNFGQDMMPDEADKKQGNFIKGVISGVLSTVVIAGAAYGIFCQTTGNRLEVISSTSSKEENAVSVLSSQTMDKIKELTGYINLHYYEEPDVEELENGMYEGLVNGLGDPYSGYYNKEKYAELQISSTQHYYGIGAGLSQDRKTMQVTVSHVYEGSPAESAGIKKDDTIVMVGDIEASSMELSELVTHIRGEEGSKVKLQIYREGESDFLNYDVERANIDLPTVNHKLLKGHVGYIRILDFGENTKEQFELAVADLEKQGMDSMMIDVRDNPGGMLTAVTGILDDILPEGTVVYMQDKYGERQDFTSSGDTKMDYPIAVLINGNSASASEILAGAIRDFEYGTLIGTKSYGKGIVQSIFPLEEGDAIKLTTATYFTPKGENIHGKGIEPDIELDYEYMGDTEEAAYDEMQDNQVLKALETLEKE